MILINLNGLSKMKKASLSVRVMNYSIMRLVRVGELSMADIVRAIGCSKPLAINIMKNIESGYPDAVRKSKTKLHLISPPAAWLNLASDIQLMNALSIGAGEADTGLLMACGKTGRPDIPVKIHKWHGGLLPDGLLTQIVKCLTRRGKPDHRASMEINYVSMRRGESAKWCRIVPLGLECVMNQWRLVAQDLNEESFLVKTYVLAHIINYRPLVDPLPKKFVRTFFNDIQAVVNITLNNALTADQEGVLRNELNISQDSKIQISERLEFEFFRCLSELSPEIDAIHPVITCTEKIKCM